MRGVQRDLKYHRLEIAPGLPSESQNGRKEGDQSCDGTLQAFGAVRSQFAPRPAPIRDPADYGLWIVSRDHRNGTFPLAGLQKTVMV